MNKKIISTAFMLILIFVTETGFLDDNGIHFFHGTWREALELAKKEKKKIFLDISASWCGPCKMLKRTTFTNSEVGEYYNKHFINMEVDGEVGEGVMLQIKYDVKVYPTLLFIDKKENEVQRAEGFRPVQQFMELGKSVGGK